MKGHLLLRQFDEQFDDSLIQLQMNTGEEHIPSFLLKKGKKNLKHIPVIKVANKEKRFSVFTNVHGSINLLDARRQAKFIDSPGGQTESLQPQVPLTWNKKSLLNSVI